MALLSLQLQLAAVVSQGNWKTPKRDTLPACHWLEEVTEMFDPLVLLNEAQGGLVGQPLVDPDFWEDFNTRNVGRSSTG